MTHELDEDHHVGGVDLAPPWEAATSPAPPGRPRGDLQSVAAAEAPPTWDLDNVELVTVGVDIGSSTSHLVLSRLHLQRLAQSLSSRFVVVHRQELHRSPILLTPFRSDGLIDVELLEDFVDRSYRDAGIEPGAVDTGVVILTGVALERANARAVAELFASHGGQFVCASAGHHLEAILAAHGSGAVALSRQTGHPVVHLDVGGGTSKLAVIRHGEVHETAAIAVGGRLVAFGSDGVVIRAEAAALQAAEHLGLQVSLGHPLVARDRALLASALAEALCDVVLAVPGNALADTLLLTEAPTCAPDPATIFTCSGGVSEYVFSRETADFNDMAAELASQLVQALARRSTTLQPTGEGIRATAIGASQFTVQLSGNTVFVSDDASLPQRNLPVVRARIAHDVDGDGDSVASALRAAMMRLDLVDTDLAVCYCLAWHGDPHYASLLGLASGLAAVHRDRARAGVPLVLALEADVGRAIGTILREELGVSGPIVSLDGIDLQELDYVDIGTPIEPSGVLPVVVKSLAFPVVA